ncbi:hypothetical protein CC86DRAFT_403924 [Ophiobolus disseminans]|uniref:Uncharacterized protein n=1 Tax=Ophiobolus disseminans TaxID=1469910 RepID=A0A6A7A962_9PLEO|nr:hypothetical protein CC86DRAFT_403924 [Ophiobolus disseminans]
MRFTLTSAVAIMAGFAASGSAFVINTYSDLNCGSGVQNDVNTWDNTCATWPDGFKSFKITTWGGSHQKAYFFAPDNFLYSEIVTISIARLRMQSPPTLVDTFELFIKKSVV